MHYCLLSSLNLAEAQRWQTAAQINAADNAFGVFLFFFLSTGRLVRARSRKR